MKKKPHQRQSVIKMVFSDFRKRVHNYEKGPNNMAYEIQKTKDGYTVVVHREKGEDET